MRERRSTVRVSKLLVAASVLVCPALSLAQTAPPAKTETEARAARFAAADRNGDGRIDRSEYYDMMMEIFFFSDDNRDGYLEITEIGGVPQQAFGAADADHDAKLTAAEYENARFEEFTAIDANHDGVLTLTEVEAAP
jgi:Ca2+-binding EF-hand superfamily protein